MADSSYIWLDPSLLGDIGNVPSRDVLPTIQIPLSMSPSPIVRLVSLSKNALRHNFLSSLLTIAGGVMVLHYRTIIQVSIKLLSDIGMPKLLTFVFHCRCILGAP